MLTILKSIYNYLVKIFSKDFLTFKEKHLTTAIDIKLYKHFIKSFVLTLIMCAVCCSLFFFVTPLISLGKNSFYYFTSPKSIVLNLFGTALIGLLIILLSTLYYSLAFAYWHHRKSISPQQHRTVNLVSENLGVLHFLLGVGVSIPVSLLISLPKEKLSNINTLIFSTATYFIYTVIFFALYLSFRYIFFRSKKAKNIDVPPLLVRIALYPGPIHKTGNFKNKIGKFPLDTTIKNQTTRQTAFTIISNSLVLIFLLFSFILIFHKDNPSIFYNMKDTMLNWSLFILIYPLISMTKFNRFRWRSIRLNFYEIPICIFIYFSFNMIPITDTIFTELGVFEAAKIIEAKERRKAGLPPKVEIHQEADSKTHEKISPQPQFSLKDNGTKGAASTTIKTPTLNETDNPIQKRNPK